MIHVVAAAPPADFDARVRQRGLDAIAELVGEKPSRARSKREKVAARREDIPYDKFPTFWRAVLPDMLERYRRLCAYLSLYIEHATGSPSVDHVVPKSKAWDQVYEWSSYRLASSFVNTKKGDIEGLLDPFAITDDLFALELVEFQVKPGAGAVGELEARVVRTIDHLGLSAPECCKARRAYVDAYLATGDYAGKEPLPFWYIEQRAPFIARELRRQGKLRPGDV